MKKEQFDQLLGIYEALFSISTKGQDTILMAKCLNTFEYVLKKLTTESLIEVEEIPIPIPTHNKIKEE